MRKQATDVYVYTTETGTTFHVVRQSHLCGCSHDRTTGPDGRHRYSRVVRCAQHAGA